MLYRGSVKDNNITRKTCVTMSELECGQVIMEQTDRTMQPLSNRDILFPRKFRIFLLWTVRYDFQAGVRGRSNSSYVDAVPNFQSLTSGIMRELETEFHGLLSTCFKEIVLPKSSASA